MCFIIRISQDTQTKSFIRVIVKLCSMEMLDFKMINPLKIIFLQPHLFIQASSKFLRDTFSQGFQPEIPLGIGAKDLLFWYFSVCICRQITGESYLKHELAFLVFYFFVVNHSCSIIGTWFSVGHVGWSMQLLGSTRLQY